MAGSGEPLSETQLVASADEICKRLSAELDRTGAPKTQQDVIRIVPSRVAAEQRALAELSKLSPPSHIAHGYRQILLDRRVLISDIQKLGQYAVAGDSKAQRVIYDESATIVRRMAATAERMGFRYCGELG